MTSLSASLKYLPAAFCGLLAAGWTGSFFVELVAQFPVGDGRGALYLENACLAATYRSPPTDWVIVLFGEETGWRLATQSPSPLMSWAAFWGSFAWDAESAASVSNAKLFRLQVPIPLLLLCAIPVAAGPFTRFRFALWSYFVWTACLAAALTCYLR